MNAYRFRSAWRTTSPFSCPCKHVHDPAKQSFYASFFPLRRSALYASPWASRNAVLGCMESSVYKDHSLKDTSHCVSGMAERTLANYERSVRLSDVYWWPGLSCPPGAACGLGEHGARDRRRAAPRQGPRQDAARELIHHDREVLPVSRHLEVRDFTDPYLIGRGYRGLPQQVQMADVPLMRGNLRANPAHGFGPQAGGRHQSRDSTATDGPAGVYQCAARTGTPVPLVMAREQADGLGGQAAVLFRMITHSAGAPGIEPRWRHAEAVTQPRHA